MKTLIKLNLLAVIALSILIGCGQIISPASPTHYFTKTIFKDANGDKILYFDKNLSYRLADKTFLKIENQDTYTALRSKHVIQIDNEMKDSLSKAKEFMVSKYHISKGSLFSIDSKLFIIVLLNQDLIYDKNNFFVIWHEENRSYDKIFHLKKEGENFTNKELALPLIDGKKSNIEYLSSGFQFNKNEYTLSSVFEQPDKQYIPIYNSENESVKLHSLNKFIQTFYHTTYDVKGVVKNHINDSITFYEDGLYIIYDKSDWNKNAKMVYKYIPFDTQNSPITLDVPIEK